MVCGMSESSPQQSTLDSTNEIISPLCKLHAPNPGTVPLEEESRSLGVRALRCVWSAASTWSYNNVSTMMK